MALLVRAKRVGPGSLADMYGMPEAPVDDETSRVRAENEYVAEQAALFPRRLVGFCSVNPTRSYALDEVARCAADSRIGGLKLHLANSDVDLRDDGQVAALGELIARANAAGLPVLIHMRTRERAYGEADARAFVERVLARAPDIPVIIAHMAGWGGYDDATDAALGFFATRAALPLAPEELGRIFANVSPIFGWRPTPTAGPSGR